MCLACKSSVDATDDHGDYRSFTWGMLSAAANAAGVTPPQALANAVMTLAYGGEPADDDDGTVTAGELSDALDADEVVAKGAVGCDVVKMVEERRYTLGVACAALRPDVAKGMDGFRDVATPEQVEKMAWAFAARNRRVGLYHSRRSDADVVESYIYRGPDWAITAADGTTRVVKAGDWLLGMIWPPEDWAAIKAGRVNGLSRQGRGKRRRLSPDVLASLRS